MIATENILLPEEIIDTKYLQLTSLRNFMGQLGYEPVYSVTGITCFESDEFCNKGRTTISFSNAVKLHNGYWLDWSGKDFKEPFSFGVYKFKRAKAARIVEVVNLQKSRKTGFTKPTSNLVSFVDKAYEYMLYSKYL